MTTTIQISDDQWKKLNELKLNPSETYINVIDRILNQIKGGNKEDDTNK